MIDISVDRASDEPLYQQIYRALREEILDGRLPPGARLPSSRRLAAAAQVGRITVMQAYDQLKAEGFIVSRAGSGVFVSETLAAASETSERAFVPALSTWGRRLAGRANDPRTERPRMEIDFGFGRSFSHIFPYDTWRKLLARYLSTDDIMLSRYGSPSGFLPLREALSAYLQRQRGVRCSPRNVIVVSGVQQGLDIVARLFLNPGDRVVVETPGYYDAYRLFRAHGATLLPRQVDEEGLPVTQMPENRQVKAAFVTPAHQFPRGGTLPLSRRLALLAWAQRNEALILEDDYDSELRYDGRPLSALQGLDESGQVVYLGTFSKVLFPALRLGYMVLPDPLLDPVTRALALVDRGAPTLTQAAVADFIDDGHFERHLRRLREAYGERRLALVQALEHYLADQVTFSGVPAGLHIMLQLDPDCDERQVIERAGAAGVGVYPGEPFYVQKPSPPSILLGFSGLEPAQIIEGVRRLGEVMPRCRR